MKFCFRLAILIIMAAIPVLNTPLAGPVYGACVSDENGNMVCTGDHSAGINVTGTSYVTPVTTLSVYDLTGSINPSAGNPGVNLTNGVSQNSAVSTGGTQGDININASNSFGIGAQSQGSAGKNGINASFWSMIQSTPGSDGTKGGNVSVTTIENDDSRTNVTTAGANALGIMAISQGGGGGDGFLWESGKGGANGGVGGPVTVDGQWDIATRGDSAYGIWAQSAGGNAGSGGSGGWWFWSQGGASGTAAAAPAAKSALSALAARVTAAVMVMP